MLIKSTWPHSLMDRISDSGSDGCGSIPHEATIQFLLARSLLCRSIGLIYNDHTPKFIDYAPEFVIRKDADC